MRAARRLRLPLAIVAGLFVFACLLSSASAGSSASNGTVAPYLDPAYASKLLQLVQDQAAWQDAETGAIQSIQDGLGDARLAAIEAGLPDPKTLSPYWLDSGPGQLSIKTDTADNWRWAVSDSGQSDYPVYAITMGTGLGTVAPFTTGHGQPGYAYWKYDPNGHLGLHTQTPPSEQWSGASFSTTVNDGQPIWALTFRGTDESSFYDTYVAGLLFGGVDNYGIGQAIWDSMSQRLQALDKGNVSSWPSHYWCETPDTYVWFGPYPSDSSGGHFACDPGGWNGQWPPSPTWYARWMDGSAIPNDPVSVSSPRPYAELDNPDYSASQVTKLSWDLDAARAVIGSNQETTNWVNCQLTQGPTATDCDAPPSNTALPTISGTARDEETLTGTDGSWVGTEPLAFTYQWLRCSSGGGGVFTAMAAMDVSGCSEIGGATGSTYLLTSDDVGSTIELQVTAMNDYGSASAISEPTDVVLAAPPLNTDLPTISGIARDEETLSGTDGSWMGTAPLAFAYQWLRCSSGGGGGEMAMAAMDVSGCSEIDSATGATYLLTSDDIGSTIELQVTATNDGGSASAISEPTDVVVAAPPSNTDRPVISGIARDEETLTGTDGTWAGTEPLAFTYQWRRCNSSPPTFRYQSSGGCTDIPGATGSSYLLTHDDVGHKIELDVTATNTAGTAIATSRATALVLAAPPSNTAVPTISGKVADGQILTGTNGTWDGTPPFAYAYQWRRCDSDGDNCLDISGATGNTYQATSDDIGSTIRLQVTATNSAGSASATSAATVETEATKPSNTALPTISGTVNDGQKLTGSSGSWSGTTPITYAYQWRRCDSAGSNCSNISSATSVTYLLTGSDIGHTIRLQVTATNAAGSASATSAQTVVVPTPPSNTVLPTISGTADVGQKLTASSGSWSGSAPISYAYQWLRCDSAGASCSDISGATGSTYVLTNADVGHEIRVQVTASNSAGSTSAQSDPTDPVAAVKPVNTALPAISGTAAVGQSLIASTGTWSGSTPMSYSYQWQRCDTAGSSCSPIQSATTSSYTVVDDDAGDALRVSVTATNAGGSTTATSNPLSIPGSSGQGGGSEGNLGGIALQLSASPAVVSPGEQVTYTLTATNTTPTPRLLDHLSLDLPSGFTYDQSSIQGGPSVSPVVDSRTLEWSGLVNLPAGGTGTISIGTGSAIAPGTYYSGASATSSGIPITPLTKSAAVQVLSQLAVTVTADRDMATPGEHVKYTVKIKNFTGAAVSFDRVYDQLPPRFEYVSNSTSGLTSSKPDISPRDATGRRVLKWSSAHQLGKGDSAELVFEAIASASGDSLPDYVEVDRGNSDLASCEGAAIFVDSHKKLALKYRPFVMFDASEPWRPLNVDKFLHEYYPSHKNPSHKIESHQIGTFWATPCWNCWSGTAHHSKYSDIDLLASKDGKDACKDPTDWRTCTPASAMKWIMTNDSDYPSSPENQDNRYFVKVMGDRNAPNMNTCPNEPKGSTRCDHNKGSSTAIYYHFTKHKTTDNQVHNYLDYWFFYRYNSPVWGGIDDHEGDWEHMIVNLGPPDPDKENPGCPTGITWVGYSAHGPLYRYQCGVLLWSGDTRASNGSAEATPAQTHADTYVAKGTHAMYPRPCFGSGDSCNQNASHFGYTIEGGFDGRAQWGRNTKKQCSKGSPCVLPIMDKKVKLEGVSDPVSEPKYPYWIDWRGYWGVTWTKYCIPFTNECVEWASPQGPYWQEFKPKNQTLKQFERSNTFEEPWLFESQPYCYRTVFDYGSPGCDKANNPKNPPPFEKVRVKMPNVVSEVWEAKPKRKCVQIPGQSLPTCVYIENDVRTNLTGEAPDYIYVTEDQHRFRFAVHEVIQHHLKVPNNHVIKTKPKAGTPLFKGDSVTVWVSKGKK